METVHCPVPQDQAQVVRPRLETLRIKLLAAGTHALISAAVASAVLVLVHTGWYPGPLAPMFGVDGILLLVIAVDVLLGPLLTLLVYDRRKRHLRVDLCCIGAMQVFALLYGILAVEAGRPHYLVFVKDRFEAVSKAELQDVDLQLGVGNPAATVSWLGPRIVAAEMLVSEKERRDLLFEALDGGRDIQHLPKQYRSYSAHAAQAAAKALPLTELSAINPNSASVLQNAVDSAGLPREHLKYLPVRGPRGDAVMLVEALTGTARGVAQLQPWR